MKSLVWLLAIQVAVCQAAPPESVTFVDVPLKGVASSSLNEVRQATISGGFALGRVDFSGSLTSVHPRTWRTDSRVLVTAPSGEQFTIRPFLSGGTFSTLPFSGSLTVPPQIVVAGNWSFRFFETYYDNAASSTPDALITLTVTLTDLPPLAPNGTSLGMVTAPGLAPFSVSPLSPGVRWFRFEIPRAASESAGTYLDITTDGSTIASTTSDLLNDTELLLFNSRGELVAADDDGGPGYVAQLSFGSGGRAPVGDGEPFNGDDGDLAAGVYYLATGPYDITTTGTQWSIVTTNPRVGNIQLAISTNITPPPPCPSDFNLDGFVDDFDFVIFAEQYELFVCDAPTMPPGCSADINADGFVDDSDFVEFATAYEAFVCPG